MNFNYNEQEYEEFPNFKGGEKSLYAKMFHDEKNRIIYGKLIPRASIGVHTHETNSEIIYITKGTGRVLMDGEYEKLEAGMCHYCPKGHTHSLMNDSDAELEFFAVVPEFCVWKTGTMLRAGRRSKRRQRPERAPEHGEGYPVCGRSARRSWSWEHPVRRRISGGNASGGD